MLKSRSVSVRTREQATNVSPQANSFFPTSITTLSRVRPCALWIVTAHASFSGSCNREHWALDADQVWRMGTIGTVPSGSVGNGY